MKKVVKMCFCCEKEIDLGKDKHVLLGTYDGSVTQDESYFHFKYFCEWYNQKVSEKAKNSVSAMQEKAKGLFSNLKDSGMLDNVGGLGHLSSMLGTNLGINGNSDIPDITQLFGIEIEDEKKEEKPKATKKIQNGKSKGKKTKGKKPTQKNM